MRCNAVRSPCADTRAAAASASVDDVNRLFWRGGVFEKCWLSNSFTPFFTYQLAFLCEDTLKSVLIVILIVPFKAAKNLPQEVQQQTHVPCAPLSLSSSSLPSHGSTDCSQDCGKRAFARSFVPLSHPSQETVLVSGEDNISCRWGNWNTGKQLPKVIH